MNIMKKVACLYRVSTKMQLNENDIPMQRKACLEFISKNPFWKTDREYIEKGVSGYHKSESQRDVLLQMKKDAENKEFDILLVFMFDRLGRREDETPLVVEWLVANGIEVWSAKEGQQRFDNRVDKLMNYIRYWQAGGESEKNSIRVAEKHKQLVQAGKFRGGPPPYGYDLVYSGELNRKGYERKKLAINEEESKVVKAIFSLCADESFGSYKMAGYLNENGIPTKMGNAWTVQTVIGVIQNPVYKGDYVSGKVKNYRGNKKRQSQESWIHSREIVQEIAIVDEKTWAIANENLKKRDTKARTEVQHTKDLLLYELAYCGYCGTKLTPRTCTSKRTLRSSGKKVIYTSDYYSCPQRMRQGVCKGQFGYGIKKIEAVVIEEVYSYLDAVKKINIKSKIQSKKNKTTSKHEKDTAALMKNIQKLESELSKLNDEIIRCLTGKSDFTSEQISKMVAVKENELTALYEKKYLYNVDLQEQLTEFKKVEDLQTVIPRWKREFEKASFQNKKELLKRLIDSIYIYHDSIDIRFTLDIYRLDNISGGKTIWAGGEPPACPVGSACTTPFGPCGSVGNNFGFCGNPLGAIAVIPTCAIACFTHNAIG